MNDIFVAYITITILGVLAAYLCGLRHRRRIVIDERVVINCSVCAYGYIVDRLEKIHRCPQCGSLNKSSE